MKIVIENVSDGEVLTYPILLIRGKIDNVDAVSLGEENSGSFNSKHSIFLTHTSEAGGSNKESLQTIPVTYFGETIAKFKYLLHLKIGINKISLEYFRIRRSVTIKYEPPYDHHSHQVKLLYIVCADSDGKFQSPCEGNEDDNKKNGQKEGQLKASNDIASAKKRISLAGAVIQSILAESLEVHGFGRKTIQFYNESTNQSNKKTDDHEPYPETFLFKSNLSTKEVYSMNQRELWEYHAKEIIASEKSDTPDRSINVKYLAIHSATRYCNKSRIVPKDHSDVLSLTKGYASIGGGDFALLGSGCLFTWPEQLSEVIPTFSNTTEIDVTQFMDDSAYRKTIGGCYATTLGAVIHELGHTFDLGHATNGFMARGFDDVDRFFTLSSDTGKHRNASKNPSSLMCCMSSTVQRLDSSPFHCPPSPMLSNSVSKLKGTNYLEEYQQKQYYRKMIIEFGNAFWDKSSALILSAHKWFNVSSSEIENQMTYSNDTKHVHSGNADIVALELRDGSGNILDFVDFTSQDSCQFIDLNPYIDKLGSKLNTFLCISYDGNMLKHKI